MTSIQLIVTGVMEMDCLHTAMKRLYPTDGRGEPVDWLKPEKTSGFTSSRVRSFRPTRPPRAGQSAKLSDIEEMAELALLFALEPCDLVLVVEDLELANERQSKKVADAFASALAHRAQLMPAPQLLSKISFHLFGFMPENYFIGDLDFWRTNAIGKRPLWHPSDLEDTVYVPFGSMMPPAAGNRTLQSALRHAKTVIKNCFWDEHQTVYTETGHGAAALKSLNWPALRTETDTDLPLISALFTDLDDFLGVNNHPFPNHLPSSATWRRKPAGTAPCTIRNI
jgi:hypothetical protein